MADKKPPGWDEQAEGDALDAFFDPFHETFGAMAGDLYAAGEAAGYKRGFAAAKAEFIKAVSGLLDDVVPLKLIEGPKPETQKPAPIFHDPIQPAPAEKQATASKPPPATSVAPKRPQKHVDIGRWTPARVAIVRERYAAEQDFPGLLAAVNALPGPPVGKDHLYSKGNIMGLRRAPVGSFVTAAERWTPERQRVIRDLYPVLTDIQDVVDAVNALPGPKIDGRVLGGYAGSSLKLVRPPAPATLAEIARKIAQDSAKPSAARPPPVPRPSAADPPPETPEQAARRMQAQAERVPMPLVDAMAPIPPHPLAVMLSPPGPDGKVAAPLRVLQMWCKLKGFGHFDGSDVDRLNKFRAGRNEPPVVVSWL